MTARIRHKCILHGHKWVQKTTYVLGSQKCARWGCQATRMNPDAFVEVKRP